MKTIKKTRLTLNKTMIANLDKTQMENAKGKGKTIPDTDTSFNTCEVFCSYVGVCSDWYCTFNECSWLGC